MKTRLVLIAILLLGCTIIFTSCTKDDLAPQLQEDVLVSDRSPAARPFKGDFITTPYLVGDPPFVYLHVEAEGNATHLGNCTWVADQIINTSGGEFEFTAANGDKIWGTYVHDGEGGTNPDGSVYFSGIMYVDGGDGRFEGADGELPYYGEATLFPIAAGWFKCHDGILIY